MSEEKTTVENNGQQEAEDLKELLQIRRDKLSALQRPDKTPLRSQSVIRIFMPPILLSGLRSWKTTMYSWRAEL